MRKITSVICLLCILLVSGCNTVIFDSSLNEETQNEEYDLKFKEKEIDASYDPNKSTYIELGDEDITITKHGTYILEGTLNNASVIVDVEKTEDVKLVLNNVTINSNDFAGIYIIEGDEITITLPEGTKNTISDSSSYKTIDSNNVDALIYSKADLIINGKGTLNLKSDFNHGIVSKDDLIICGGNYNIETAGSGLSGKDRLKISDGTFRINTNKDAIKSDNHEEKYRGYVYIRYGTFDITSYGDAIYGYSLVYIDGGNYNIKTINKTNDSNKAVKSVKQIVVSNGDFEIESNDDGFHCDEDLIINGGTINIASKDDGIHSDYKAEINDGNISIKAREGIEATYVQINGGTINISATDDGINAGKKTKEYDPTFEMNDGNLTIVVGEGDTDGIDSNGYIIVNGGKIDITCESAFDYDKGSEFNGGTIIVNGEEINEITNQFNGFGDKKPGSEKPDQGNDE